MDLPRLAFATPRKLPKAAAVPGRVAVLDIAFAAGGTGASFEKVTGVFLAGLGPRLAVWVDHHDHEFHGRYRDDPRFVLATKAEHGACPEMITPALVARIGAVDTIVCHLDLDGLYSAAKWIRGGAEPYPGADDDARVVDTRIGESSPMGAVLDRVLRVRGRDEATLTRVVRFLAEGAADTVLRAEFEATAAEWEAVEERTRALAEGRFEVRGDVALCDVAGVPARDYDKTALLLFGQARARVAVVCDDQNVTLAAAFDSGLNFLAMLGVQGGMPTVLSVPRGRLDEVLAALRTEKLYR